MNKIYIFAAILVLACSDGDKFSEEKRDGIFIDDILWNVSRDTLFLNEELFIEYEGQERSVYLRQLDGYLQNFFWVIDNDTIGDYRPKRKISYGEHFIQLSLIDIWGDTLSYSLNIFHKEPLSITLLSPVDNFPDFQAGDTVMFEYKINDENVEHAIYACAGSGCTKNSLWDKSYEWKYKTAVIPKCPVLWGVMASTGERTEVRSVCPED
jgi:hypothetical protein